MKRFLAVVTRPADVDPEILARHKDYLQALLDRGSLLLSGPFGEAPGGAYLLRAADQAAAQAIVKSDPMLLDPRAEIVLREWVIRLDAMEARA